MDNPPGPSGPSHAIVVDEDHKLAAQLEALLQDANFKVTVMQRGWDALHVMGLDESKGMRPVVPDLLVIESGLPDRKGFEVLGRMRQTGHTHRVPVILMAKPGVAIPEFAAFDANVCLRKPFETQVFLNAVIKALGLEG